MQTEIMQTKAVFNQAVNSMQELQHEAWMLHFSFQNS